jgi:ring-1,2-phenylacetyl-CoA epoxidase subunit PaaD
VTEQQNIDPALLPVLMQVADPEIPVLSVVDMGVVRSALFDNNIVKIEITPTYSGCPAMDVIGDDIKKALNMAGYIAEVKLILAPAWTTDWITEAGRSALQNYGIAPPLNPEADKSALLGQKRVVPCPQCGSTNTIMVSQFGSTACKALFKCEDCLEPFDYFKCLR